MTNDGGGEMADLTQRSDGALFTTVHEIAQGFAGRPVEEVAEVLLRRLPSAPGIQQEEIRKIAEEISVGRDPSGL